jgi:hypothetical protein
MTDYIRTEFRPEILNTYVGYHVQIFRAGRAKLSLQLEGVKKTEFYASLPKNDRKAYLRQRVRSQENASEHFNIIEDILRREVDAKIYRLHEKGNNNKTADNAHLLVSQMSSAMWVVMSGMVHKWELEQMLTDILIMGRGKRVGEPSVFNEYMPTIDHDWEDAEFELSDYKQGLRLKGLNQEAEPSAQSRQLRKSNGRPKHYENYGMEDPRDDPVLYATHDDSEQDYVDDGFERVE